MGAGPGGSGVRVGVDVGGTFTDVVAVVGGRVVHGKVLTRPREPWVGIVEGVESVGVDIGSIEVFVTATTLGTNLFFGQTGLERPPAALFTDEGFEDVVEIGRQNRPSLYDPFFTRPPPLAGRRDRIGVGVRVSPRGEVLREPDLSVVRGEAARRCSEGYVFAVSVLHGYLRPDVEEEIASAVREACPGATVVTGSSVDPRPGEYERASTALVNAVLAPIVRGYLERLSDALRLRGFRGRLLAMKSDGGVATPGEVLRAPAVFIESGPAAGAVAAAYIAGLLGVERLVAFDMGGTTAKASSVVSGRPEVVEYYEVGGRVHMGRLVRGSGYPVRHEFIDIAEVGAGGGTIAWVDRGGALRLGPHSAGAEPGPACYGRGGGEPTVTDALLLLGRIPGELAGGRLRLRRDLAEAAMQRLAREAGLRGALEAAEAVVALANAVMARALRIVTVERGHDPEEFQLAAFGGAGPVHAVELAREMGVPRVVVPPRPGVFSALGLLLSDYRVGVARHVGRPASGLDEAWLEEVFRELEGEALERLRLQGYAGEARLERVVEARYRWQGETLRLPYRGARMVDSSFHALHEEKYGFSSPRDEVVVEAVRVVAVGAVEKPGLAPEEWGRGLEEEWRVYWEGSWLDALLVGAGRLWELGRLEGPAVVAFPDSTLFLPPGATARPGSHGEVVVDA